MKGWHYLVDGGQLYFSRHRQQSYCAPSPPSSQQDSTMPRLNNCDITPPPSTVPSGRGAGRLGGQGSGEPAGLGHTHRSTAVDTRLFSHSSADNPIELDNSPPNTNHTGNWTGFRGDINVSTSTTNDPLCLRTQMIILLQTKINLPRMPIR